SLYAHHCSFFLVGDNSIIDLEIIVTDIGRGYVEKEMVGKKKEVINGNNRHVTKNRYGFTALRGCKLQLLCDVNTQARPSSAQTEPRRR
ncbi:hypothetical protein M378DRAFT_166270, partial [Amanita muscaria Koide BX008]